MPNYKLHYFNVRGRAEGIRLIFAAAGQKYEDYRIEMTEWPNKKKDYKFGKLPVLEVDNEKLNQTVAIMQYLALQFGLAGKTPLENAKCHAAVETLRDFLGPLFEKLMRDRDPQKRPQMLKEIEGEVKTGLAMLEDWVKDNKTGFLIGNQVTYADLEFIHVLHTLSEWYGADLLKPYPNVQKVYTNVSNQQKIKEYLANRPKTMM